MGGYRALADGQCPLDADRRLLCRRASSTRSPLLKIAKSSFTRVLIPGVRNLRSPSGSWAPCVGEAKDAAVCFCRAPSSGRAGRGLARGSSVAAAVVSAIPNRPRGQPSRAVEAVSDLKVT